ncbi:MAG: GAF domain-containing protein [Thermoleophilaceae bacterium]
MTSFADHRLQRLIEVGRSLVSELDLEVVLERLLEVARELTGARYAAVGILDPSKSELERFVTSGIDPETHQRIGDLPRGRGVLGLLIREPRPLRLREVSRHPESYGFPPEHPAMSTFLGVPVTIRGEAWGNLYLTEKEGGVEFSDEDERSIVVLADWAAIAIENARLYRHAEERRVDLERAVRGLEVTTAIARAVGGETELGRVLELIVKRARALVEARALVVMLVEGEELVIAATAGEVADGVEGTRFPLRGSVSEDVLLSRRPERVSDVRARRMQSPGALGIEATAALAAPLIFRGQPLGALIAFDRLGGPQFRADDEELMLSFAASAATAVHTARSVTEERLTQSLEAAEQERSRWARELHDETLQGLGGLQVLLASALRKGDAEAREGAMRQALEHISGEIDNLRNLITELRPAELDELGLESALEALAERRAARDPLEVGLDIDLAGEDGARRLARQTESTIYRIVQEALTNAAKHAEATRVDVRLAFAYDTLELVISDDGRGFDPLTAPGGFGLVGMRERIALVRGTFEIDSRPGAGTTLRVTVPVEA